MTAKRQSKRARKSLETDFEDLVWLTQRTAQLLGEFSYMARDDAELQQKLQQAVEGASGFLHKAAARSEFKYFAEER